MPGLNTAALNGIVKGDNTVWPPARMSAHTADPGNAATPTAGTELTGDSYARQALTWGAASNGAASASATFSVPALGSGSVTHVGYWKADGTTYLGSRALSVAQPFPTAGSLTHTATETATSS